MKDNKQRPLPIDPVDGTKVYMPLEKRFSVAEQLADIDFEANGNTCENGGDVV